MANFNREIDAATETFYAWLEKTNQLLKSLSTEIITANSSVGITGSQDLTQQRRARLFGQFAANVLVAETYARGGNTTHSNTLTVYSNVIHIGQWANSYANVYAENNIFTVNTDNTHIKSNTYIQYSWDFTDEASGLTPFVDDSRGQRYGRSEAIRILSNTTFNSIKLSATEFQTQSDNTYIVSANTTIAGNTNIRTSRNLEVTKIDSDTGKITIDTSSDHNLQDGNIINLYGSNNYNSSFTFINADQSGGGDANTIIILTPDWNFATEGDGTSIIANISVPTQLNINVYSTGYHTANVDIFANVMTLQTGNVHITGTDTHTIEGNVVFTGIASGSNWALTEPSNTALYIDSFSEQTIHRPGAAGSLHKGRVGILTTTPNASLHVNGTANIEANTWIGGNTYIANTTQITGNTSISDPSFLKIWDDGTTIVTNHAGAGVDIDYRFIVNTVGNVGIMVDDDTPDAVLQVGVGYTTGTANIHGDTWIAGHTYIANTLTVHSNTTILDPSHFMVNDDSGYRFIVNENGNTGINVAGLNPDAKLQVVGTANVSANTWIGQELDVVANGHFGDTISIQDNILIDYYANANLGADTGYIPTYTFPKADYHSGKFTASVKNGTNWQTSEFVVTQDGTTAKITVYATVSSGSDLADFSVDINGNDVRILIDQTTASSALKLFAQLIK